MRVFVTIITAAFFAHWTSSLIGIRANGISNSDYPVISRDIPGIEQPRKPVGMSRDFRES